MSMTAKPSYDVVVVGAGLSGLQAALTVRAAGFTVCVLEANNRVGGKTLTLQSCEKGFNDMGAAWINDTNQSEMFKLFQKYGIDAEMQLDHGDSVLEPAVGSIVKVPYGQLPGDPTVFTNLMEVLRAESAIVDLNNPSNSPGAKEIDQTTFEDFCISRTKSDEAADIADLICSALLGVESDEVSALFMLHYIKCGARLLLILGANGLGNQTISRKMAKELGPRSVLLRNPVTSIEQSQGTKCVITTESGLVVHSRKVIVSVPTTLYPSIKFNPPLPEKKAALGENTAMGYYSKMIFVFHKPWWRNAGFSGCLDAEIGPISFSRDTSIPADSQWSITCFIVGERGRQWSKLSKAARYRQVWEQFSRGFGKFVENVPEPANTLEVEWLKQAFFLGAPCPVMAPGVMTTVGTELTTSFENIHFVGTETASVWRGYMEGAVRSGQRGGAEAIQALSKELNGRG
ncbi:flavin-containing amine oxidase [Penicillium lagena]|uniref:flavin-containing amine oxidase n=1 Tax=Penicillium lagena TaxID=94218 RepID=UPI0025414A0D|nr:flavin-containing amine oxidase [Penicillium lagena]KAJ5605759.1 flavin-containing amine oxidase [Penicillium lagena]